MRKTKVERVADELARECRLVSDDGPDARYVLDRTRLVRLARHVLAREKRARGRTEGYVAIVHQFGGHPAILLSRDGTTLTNARAQAAAEEGDVARLVLVPKKGRKKGGSRG